MFKRLWRWLIDIPAHDPIERDANASLQLAVLAFVCATSLSFILNLFVPGRWNSWVWLMVFVFSVSGAVLVFFWLRRGQFRAAVRLLLVAVLLAAFMTGVLNGINNSQLILVLFSVFVILAVGLLLPWRWLILGYLAVALLLVGGSTLEANGLIPLLPQTARWDIVAGRGLQTTSVIIAIGLFARFFSWRLHRALYEGQAREAELHGEIGKRERAQQALQAREQDLALLFEQAPIPMAISELDGRFVRVNRALCQMLGYSAEELLQRTFANITHPEDLNKNLELIQQAMRGEIGTYEIEKRYLRRDGQIVVGVLHGMILRDAHQQPRQILGQVLDVTESRKTETALRESEERFRALAENIPSVIYVCENNFDFNILYVNDAILALTGYPKEEFLSGRVTFRDLFHPTDSPRILPEDTQAAVAGQWQVFHHQEYRIRHISGEWRWVEEWGTVVFGFGPEPVLEGFLVDITARKQAELALRQSEERFHALAENMPSIVFICRDDFDYTVLYLNDAVEAVTGYSKEAFLSGQVTFPDLYHPTEDPVNRHAPPVHTKPDGEEVYYQEYRLRHASGEWRWIEERSSLLTLPNGERAFHGIITDITPRKTSEAELSLRLTEQTLLYEIGQALTSTTTAEEVQQIVCKRMAQYLDGTSAFYETYLVEEASVRTDYEYWTERATPNERQSVLGGLRLLRDCPAFERSKQIRQPVVLHRTDMNLSVAERELIEGSDGQTVVVMPAIAQDNFLGFFEIWDNSAERDFDKRTLQLLLTVGAQAAAALDNIASLSQRQQAQSELTQRLAEQTLLYELGHELALAQTNAAVFQIVTERLATYLNASSVYFLRYFPERQLIQMDYEYWTERANPQERQSALGQMWPIAEYTNFFNAVRNNWPQLQTVADSDLLPTEKAALEFWNGKTALVVPVLMQDRPIGYLEIWDSTAIHRYDERTLRVLLTIANQVAGQLENIRLVNELKEAVTRSHELATIAESANRLKAEIIANISHELRTPLTAIQGGLGLVLQDMIDNRDEEKYWLNIAYDGSDKLLKLINALLNVAKIEASQIQLSPTAVDIPLLMREVEGHIRPLAEMKGLTFKLAMEEFAEWVWLDYERTRQILLSLLQNAVKFTEAGSISLAARHIEGKMVFIVQDTGIGITSEVREQLFRPFVQGDGSTTRRFGGFGMGLYIAQRLAELMKGHLEIYSAGEGLGTTVTLYLPWRLAEAELSLETLMAG